MMGDGNSHTGSDGTTINDGHTGMTGDDNSHSGDIGGRTGGNGMRW